MSVEITVIFYADLTSYAAGHCSPEENTAIQAIRDSTENVGLTGAAVRYRSEVALVLLLPKHEKVLGDLIYWCDYGGLPYRTLWLNDVAQWREGGKNDKTAKR